MPDKRLSTKERAVLLALLAEARELSNPELERRVGFRLDGRERRRLNELKLVDSHRSGRSYAHELSEEGWRWCAAELPAGPGPRASSMERALYAVLAGMGRHLARTDRTLSDIFGPGERSPEGADIEDRIKFAYRGEAGAPGELIPLSTLRGRLADLPRTELDAALERMYRAQRINLVPRSDQWALTDADRAAAVRVGGEHKHLLSIEKR